MTSLRRSIYLICFALVSCNTVTPLMRYQAAVQDAMYPTEEKVSQDLIPIASANSGLIRKVIDGEEHILVVSWKAKNYYPDSGTYNTGMYEIWVTTAPELRNRISGVRDAHKQLRVTQLLGLPPTADYKYFIEFWVRPADLFRPCPDGETNDSKCNVCFGNADSLHKKWINEYRLSAYYTCGLQNQYPWTQLGYTYDWSPKNRSHRGCSEFVIRKASKVYVNKVYTNAQYFSSTSY